MNDVDWRVRFVKSHILSELEEPFIFEHISLVKQCAWLYYLDGNARNFEKYMDRVYKVGQGVEDPLALENTILLSSFDYRIPAFDYMKKIRGANAISQSSKRNTMLPSASITLNFPYAHRSMRDYSECANNLEPFLELSRQSIGRLLGKEYDVLEDCVRAGIYYERNDLERAYEAAQKAVSSRASSSPEILFCAYMIFLKIMYALQDHKEAHRVEIGIEEMVETKNAPYLEPNYLSAVCDKHMLEGRKSIAEEWLAKNNTERNGQLTFYQMHQHFTTGRAYLLLGFYEEAILFLKKVSYIGNAYRRPLDFIQANILLSIAYWQNNERQSSFQAMEQALLEAQQYGFTKVFFDENTDFVQPILESMLKRIRSLPSSKVQKSFLYQLLGKEAESERTLPQVVLSMQTTPLSPKQLEVLALMKKGMPYRQIAQSLGIKQTTVKSHVKLIFKKLNVNCCEAAVVVAERLGLLG